LTPDAAAQPTGPLHGVGVIVTRPPRQAARLGARLAALGARPIVWPAIIILPPADPGALAAVHERLQRFDMAIFVSANAVEYGAPERARWPDALPIFAPGVGTAEALEAVGLPAPTIPRASFDSEGLLALPALCDVAGKRVVVFRGEDGRALLGDTLRARGAQVEYVSCYRRAAPSSGAEGLVQLIARGDAHALTLTSAEGLRNLVAALPSRTMAALARMPTFVQHARIVAEAREAGLDAHLAQAGDGGLLGALLEWFSRHPATARTS
jgi:uroporphyrinogen-III synthase